MSGANTSFTGSITVQGSLTASLGFTGSFVGDGSGLTGIIASPGIVYHNETVGYSASRHIDHTAVQITGTAGLLGGGSIAESRTIILNTSSTQFINGVTAATIASGAAAVKQVLPPGVVSGSVQVKALLPIGVVSGSVQVKALLPLGVVSGSIQVKSLLPPGVVSGSVQVKALLPIGVVSGSVQVKALLPLGVVSGSIQVKSLLPPGVVSGSVQVKALLPIGVVSGSVQVKALLPPGVISGSIPPVEVVVTGGAYAFLPVTHSLDSRFPTVVAYRYISSGVYEMTIPQTVKSTGLNTSEVTFSSPFSGSVVFRR